MSVLGIILSIVLWLLAIVAGLLLVLFVVPFSLGLNGWVSGLSGEGEADLSWGFGLLSVRAVMPGGFEARLMGLRVYRTTFGELVRSNRKELDPDKEAAKEAKKAAAKAKRNAKKKAKRKEKGRFKLAYVRPLLTLVLRVLGSVHLTGWVAGMVGVGDPAETAAIAVLLERLNRSDGRFVMDVTPNWIDEVLDVQGDVRLRFWLPRTALVVIRILLDREARQLLRAIA